MKNLNIKFLIKWNVLMEYIIIDQMIYLEQDFWVHADNHC